MQATSYSRLSRWLFVAVCIPLLVLGLYIRPADDDFVYWNMAHAAGTPIAFAAEMYASWSGRIVTHLLNGMFFSTPQLFPLFALVPPLAFAVLPLSFVQTLRSFGVHLSNVQGWIIAICTLCALYVALLPYIGECVFWLTGGLVYVVPLLAGVIWFALATTVDGSSVGRALFVALAAIPVALTNEQVTAALLVAAIATAVVRHRLSWQLGAAVLMLTVGSILLVGAPGNAVRASNAQHGLAYSPLAWLGNYFVVLGDSWARYLAPAAVGALVGAALAGVRGSDAFDRLGLARWSLVTAAAAVGATLPFVAVPDFASARTAFIPGAFLLMATAGGTFCLVGARPLRIRKVGLSLATGLVATYLGLAIVEVGQAQRIQAELQLRWDTLEGVAGSDKDLTLPPLANTRPLSVFVGELSDNPRSFNNAAVAAYFGLRSVRVGL